MNDLSWFLYYVDVAAAAGDVISFIGVISSILVLIAVFCVIVTSSSADTDEGDKKINKFSRDSLKILIPLTILATVIVVLLPSTRTLYLIMGSEIGEEVVQSETAKRVHDAVNKKLDEYLNVE